MLVTIKRNIFGKEYTGGEMYLDGKLFCYTLEDTDRFLETGSDICTDCVKIAGETAIPRGKYKVVVDYSNRFKKMMIHVLDVPQFAGVRIHGGNKVEDTEGCPLVAFNRNEDGNKLIDSAPAARALFDAVDAALNRKEEVWLEVV